MTSVG